ncbi:MAG: twin-arginine translocase TatA/TatE family subunit [Arcticibacter sp.]|jgi:sec-independent protein translocase protein TatA
MTLALTLGIMGLGATEIILILVVLLLFFGGKRIPELARGLGKGIREFKDASSGKPNDEEKKEIENK